MTKKSISRLLQASLMCCLAVLFTACDDIFASEDNPIPAYLSMSDKPVTIKVGDTYRRKAISVTSAVVEYTSSKTDVATVDNEGLVTAKAEGTTTITATATGYSSQTGKKIYQPDSKSYKVTVGGGSVVPPGSTALATPLTMEAITAGTIVVTSPQAGMQYSLNGGAKQAVTTDAITVAVGDKVAFYGNGTAITSYYGTQITGGTAEVKVYGNIMSLVDETGFATAISLTANYTFRRLFYGNNQLKDASGLLLPATTLTGSCYYDMFNGCTSLTAAPELPATQLAISCYTSMFNGCTSLTAAPELPATDLTGASSCYSYMFRGCTSLTTAPELKATKIAYDCYSCMFYGCTSLTTAPAELPAMTMASQCYAGMFFNCTSLTTAPKLPATTLASTCYLCMFYGCTSLTTAYVKAAYTNTISNVECDQMFYGCTATGAVLHTSSGNVSGWSGYMGSIGSNWSVVGDY